MVNQLAGHIKLHYCRLEASGGVSAREAERMASLKLARVLAGPEAEISHFEDGAPFINGHDGYISISHGAGLCVLVASRCGAVGVDVERWRAQLQRVAPKFLADCEMKLWGGDNEALLRAWTIKEAVYKAARTPGMALKEICLPKHTGGDEATARGRVYALHTMAIGDAMITVAWAV